MRESIQYPINDKIERLKAHFGDPMAERGQSRAEYIFTPGRMGFGKKSDWRIQILGGFQ